MKLLVTGPVNLESHSDILPIRRCAGPHVVQCWVDAEELSQGIRQLDWSEVADVDAVLLVIDPVMLCSTQIAGHFFDVKGKISATRYILLIDGSHDLPKHKDELKYLEPFTLVNNQEALDLVEEYHSSAGDSGCEQPE